MNNKDINKPNKKSEVIGLVLFILGLIMIILRIFVFKEAYLTIIGVILFIVGAYFNQVGKFGFQKTVEMSSQYDIAKSKEIAKAVKEGLEEDEK